MLKSKLRSKSTSGKAKAKPLALKRVFDRPQGIPQSITNNNSWRIRQLCFPSSTAMTVSGTGVVYTPSQGLLTGTTNTGFFSLYFRLADFPQASGTFGPLCDQYRISEVKVSFFPQMIVNYQGASGQLAPPIYTVCDYDDSSVLTAITDIFQYQNAEIHSPYKPFSMTLKPRVAVPSGTGFANLPAQWLDTADQTVQHYGVKGVIPWINTSMAWNVIVEASIELRSVR